MSVQPKRTSPLSLSATLADPAWLAHRYDPGHDAFHLIHLPREERERITFLTEEFLPKDPQTLVAKRREAAEAAVTGPLHFVFHSAFCCSTMVARAFDRPGWAMSLREPVVLNDLVGWRRRGGQGPDMAKVLDDTLTMLARPFRAGEAVVVKPSNIVNALAPAMLALRPDARALLLYAPLRTFLTSVAKKGLDGRLWVRTLLLGLLEDRLPDIGFSHRDYLGQSDLQIAAVGWLLQQRLFGDLVQRFGAARVRTLDSETLTRDPGAAMGTLASLFAMPLSPDELGEIVRGPAFTRHSKLDTSFAVSERAVEHREAAEAHADEINKVTHWAEVVADRLGVALLPPAPLMAGTHA